MITKSKPAMTAYGPETIQTWFPNRTYRKSYSRGAETIQYSEGPQYANGRCNWKKCDHTYGLRASFGGSVYTEFNDDPSRILYGVGDAGLTSLSAPKVDCPSASGVFSKIWDQLDLNCHDSVMLYSGILQAIPLVGGAFKFVDIMNRLGRKLTRDIKRKPFTTVLRSAISLDFINRFVVRPTLDDARKFINAHNHVINVMNTMYERSGMLPTAYEMQSEVQKVHATRAYSCSPAQPSTPAHISLIGEQIERSVGQTKVYVLANVAYNTSAADPIKLWATRLGVTRPLDSFWDLVPFSFVVDYFTRAGEFISSVGDELTDQDALRGVIQKVHGCWCTQKVTRERVATFTSYNSGVGINSLFIPGTARTDRGRFLRFPCSSLDTAPEDPSGFFRLDLSTVRARTIAELIVQMKGPR